MIARWMIVGFVLWLDRLRSRSASSAEDMFTTGPTGRHLVAVHDPCRSSCSALTFASVEAVPRQFVGPRRSGVDLRGAGPSGRHLRDQQLFVRVSESGACRISAGSFAALMFACYAARDHRRHRLVASALDLTTRGEAPIGHRGRVLAKQQFAVTCPHGRAHSIRSNSSSGASAHAPLRSVAADQSAEPSRWRAERGRVSLAHHARRGRLRAHHDRAPRPCRKAASAFPASSAFMTTSICRASPGLPRQIKRIRQRIAIGPAPPWRPARAQQSQKRRRADEKLYAAAMTLDEVQPVARRFITAAQRAETAPASTASNCTARTAISSARSSAPNSTGATMPMAARREPRPLPVRDHRRCPCATKPGFSLSVRLSPERWGIVVMETRHVAQRLMREGNIDFIDMSLWDFAEEPSGHAFPGPHAGLVFHRTRPRRCAPRRRRRKS